MNVHIPEAGHQIPAIEIDHLCVVGGTAHLSARQDGADAAILDQHGSIRPYLGLDAVEQVRMRKDGLHSGLFRLKLEILGSTAPLTDRDCRQRVGWWSEQALRGASPRRSAEQPDLRSARSITDQSGKAVWRSRGSI